MDAERLARLREFLLVNELAPVKMQDGTGVLVNLSGMEVLSLNETGMFVLGQVLGGSDTIGLIGAAVSEEFSVERGRAEAEARSFIDALALHLNVS